MRPSTKVLFVLAALMGVCSSVLLVLSIIMNRPVLFAIGFLFCIISALAYITVNWCKQWEQQSVEYLEEPEEYNGQDFMDYPQ